MSIPHTSPPNPAEDSQRCHACRPSAYPLFETMLQSKGLSLQPTYTCQDIATVFGVTARTIQSKVKDGTLPSRKLIGGARFLPIDIETYLRNAGAERPDRVRETAGSFAR